MNKSLVFLFLFLAGCSSAFAQAVSPPWPEGALSAYFGPNQALMLTVTSENGIVSVLDVPKGVFLNVVAVEDQNPGIMESLELPITFRGDMTIRTRREDEIEKPQGRAAHEFMATSPLVMTLKSAVVILEAVEETTE
jgi:hypothetical protein